MARLILNVALVCLQVSYLRGQSTIHDFRPNALGVGYGGSLVVQARDPSAIFWNPALLSGLKYRGMLISVNEPFRFDFIGLTQYLPLFGTVGAALTRMSDSTRTVDGGTVAWGRKVFRGASIGANFTMSRQGGSPAASLGFGVFLGNPEIGSLESPSDTRRYPGHLDQLNVGVTVQGLPLSKKLFDPAVLLGLSYQVPASRVLLNTGYHIRTPRNTFHTGLAVNLSRYFRLFAGTEDFESDAFGVGASFSLQHFWINASYSRTLNQILVSFSARISPKTGDLAAPHYTRGRAHFKSGDEALANSELRKYLSYDLGEAKTDTAASIVRYLELKLTRRRTRIDSLFAQAQRFLEEAKPQTLRAAYNYSKILELDKNNLKARIKLTALQPRVDRFVKRWLAEGVYEYEAGNHEKAQLQFKKVLLFKKENRFALSYLDKIDRFYSNLGQEHFFRGVGFLSNKEYALATQEFNLALKYSPQMADARRYLNITDQRAKEEADTISALLQQAVSLEGSQKVGEAVKKYKEVLQLDEQNDHVKSEIKRLERLLAQQRRDVARRRKQAVSYFAQAKQAFEGNEWQKALDLDSAGLKIIPNNQAAIARKIETQKRLQAQGYLAMGKVDFSDENYQDALIKFLRAAELDSSNAEVGVNIARTKLKIDELVKIYFDEGISLYTQDKYEEAIAKWNEALQLDPQHEGTLDYIAQAQERLQALRAIKK